MRNTGFKFYKHFSQYFPFKNTCLVWGEMQQGTPPIYHSTRAALLCRQLGKGNIADFGIIVSVVRHLMIYWVKSYGETIPDEAETPSS